MASELRLSRRTGDAPVHHRPLAISESLTLPLYAGYDPPFLAEKLVPTEHPAIEGAALVNMLVPRSAAELGLPDRCIPWALCGSYMTSRSGQAIVSGCEKRERTGIELEVRGKLVIRSHPCDFR